MRSHIRVPPTLVALVLAASLQAAVPPSCVAQANERDLDAIASWVAVDAATGYEGRVAPALATALGEWRADAWGNVVSTIGAGSPHRIVACALDRPSYAVSQITADGYLRLHRIGRGSRHPLWDQQFEAQQVRVLTAAGPVAAVVARSNGHFAPQHRDETALVTADDLWVDVGAESRADVEALSIRLLDPVGRHLPPWPIAGGVAGPDAGRRTGCAAIMVGRGSFGNPCGRLLHGRHRGLGRCGHGVERGEQHGFCTRHRDVSKRWTVR